VQFILQGTLDLWYANFLEKKIHTIIDLAIFSDILSLSPESHKRGIAYDIEDWWTFG
jgi:hypothetical protein